MSTTIPNARCPICNAQVFFYESYAGGRTYFDELGPPWPKHSCTDANASIPRPTDFLATGAAADQADSLSSPQWKRDGWMPLENITISGSTCSILMGNSEDGDELLFGMEGQPRFTENDPVLVRRSEAGDGTWDISYIPMNSMLARIVPETVQGFPFVKTRGQIRRWKWALDGDPDAHNLVGMWLSFSRGTKHPDGSWAFAIEPDWGAAELHFLMAAACGLCPGFHNLGAMYRHGFGVRHDPQLAFHLTLRAAELADDEECQQSIAALSELMELGWGSEEDRAEAEMVLEAEREI